MGERQSSDSGLRQETLIAKAKVVCGSEQNQECLHCFPWIGRCSAISRERGPIMFNGDLGRQMLSFQMSPPSLIFICWAWHYGLGYPVGIWGQLCLLPTPGEPPASSQVRWNEKQKSLDAVNAAQQYQKIHILSTLFSAQIQNTAPDFKESDLYPSQNQHSICYYFKD